MSSKILKSLLVGAGLLALLAVAVFGSRAYFLSKFKTELHKVLVSSEAGRGPGGEALIVGSYESVTAPMFVGPSGPFSVKKITLASSKEMSAPLVTIDEIVCSDFMKNNGIINQAHFKINGIVVPVLNIAQEIKNKYMPETLADVVGMGYTSIGGDAELNWKINDGDIKFETSVDINDIMFVHFKSGFTNVSYALIENMMKIHGEFYKNTPYDLLAQFSESEKNNLVEQFAKAEISDLQLKIRDKGLRERATEFYASYNFPPDDPGDVEPEFAIEVREFVIEQLGFFDVSPELTEKIANQASRYVREGGEIKFSTQIKKPIPVIVAQGEGEFAPAPALQSVDAFFGAAAAAIEHNRGVKGP